MSNFIERLQEYMANKGINDNQMTVAAGLSVGLLGKAKNAGKGMSSLNIEKILCAYPDLSAEWLLTGRGEMLKNEGAPSPQAPPQIISELLTKISDQAEEIGRLKAHIDDLQRRRGDNAGHAQSSAAALTG